MLLVLSIVVRCIMVTWMLLGIQVQIGQVVSLIDVQVQVILHLLETILSPDDARNRILFQEYCVETKIKYVS